MKATLRGNFFIFLYSITFSCSFINNEKRINFSLFFFLNQTSNKAHIFFFFLSYQLVDELNLIINKAARVSPTRKRIQVKITNHR